MLCPREALVKRRLKIGSRLRKGFSTFLQYWQLDLFPLRKTLRGYNKEKARSDLKAGLNSALLSFPQGMAYAQIAGLPIQYGIYGAAIASILGPIFAGSRFIMLGPTNATSVLLFTTFLALNVTAAEKMAMMPLLLVMIGLFLLVGALLRAANFIQYISRTVVTGYITAAALYIIINQLRKVFGIEFEIPAGTTFFGIVRLTATSLPALHLPSLLLGLITVGIFIFIKKRFRFLPHIAIALCLASLVAFAINYGWDDKLVMLESIDASNWPFTLPPFNDEWFSQLAGVAATIAFLSILEGLSIGKSLAARSGERLNANQEMFSMGMANFGCALYGGMPASGSLTRSQLNWSGGAATPLASIYCGLFCVVAAFLLGPYIKFIPQAALGVLVIVIGLSLINPHNLRVVTKTTRADTIVFITTFSTALLVRLDFAIILGAITSILLFLHKAAMPELVEYSADQEGQLTPLQKQKKRPNPEVSIVHVEGDLFFGAAELFRDQMRRVVEDPNLKVVVLKMRNAYHLDASSVLALEELIKYMREKGRTLLVSEARKPVIRVFKNSNLIDVIGRENIFADAAQNPTLSTARALTRAPAILGSEKAKVRIFTRPSPPPS